MNNTLSIFVPTATEETLTTFTPSPSTSPGKPTVLVDPFGPTTSTASHEGVVMQLPDPQPAASQCMFELSSTRPTAPPALPVITSAHPPAWGSIPWIREWRLQSGINTILLAAYDDDSDDDLSWSDIAPEDTYNLGGFHDDNGDDMIVDIDGFRSGEDPSTLHMYSNGADSVLGDDEEEDAVRAALASEKRLSPVADQLRGQRVDAVAERRDRVASAHRGEGDRDRKSDGESGEDSSSASSSTSDGDVSEDGEVETEEEDADAAPLGSASVLSWRSVRVNGAYLGLWED